MATEPHAALCLHCGHPYPAHDGLDRCPPDRRTTWTTDEQAKALEGLPPDLIGVLRDQSVVVSQDGAVFDLISRWQHAPSDTASAHIEGEPDAS